MLYFDRNCKIYFPGIVEAYKSPKHIFSFPQGNRQPSSHIARLRELRRYLVNNPDKIPSPYHGDADFFTFLRDISFWFHAELIHIGIKRYTPIDASVPSIIGESYNEIHSDLSEQQVTALCILYSSDILSIPCRIHSPSESTIILFKSCEAQLPNLGIRYSDEFILLI